MKFAEFLKKLFTHNIPLKLLALAIGVACAIGVHAAYALSLL